MHSVKVTPHRRPANTVRLTGRLAAPFAPASIGLLASGSDLAGQIRDVPLVSADTEEHAVENLPGGRDTEAVLAEFGVAPPAAPAPPGPGAPDPA